MSESTESTYILDSESAAEMARLINADRVTTKGMGGILAGIPKLPHGAHVLDIACGPGGWVLDLAYARPDVEVAGIDISQTMTAYANARARTQQLPNASFGVMDVRQPLDFADNSFDLVNARWIASFMPRAAWPELLSECFRVTKPGAIIRLTESDSFGITTSPAYERFLSLVYQMMFQRGHGFSPDGKTIGITPKLRRLLHDAGCQTVELQAHVINFSADSEAWPDFYHNAEIANQMVMPLLIKTGIVSQEEITALYNQVAIEMRAKDFDSLCYLLTAWGVKP